MEFIIRINLDNDAFAPGVGASDMERNLDALGPMLTTLTRHRLPSLAFPAMGPWPLLDPNGNTVGVAMMVDRS